MPIVPISSNTQAQMKLDIADELARADLTSQIAAAIATAIDTYQPERFEWSESRDLIFNTVASQEFYTDADLGGSPAFPLSTVFAFDYVILYLGGIPWPMHRVTDKEMEVLNQNGLVKGQPYNWTYYNNQLRLGPIPDAVYQIRVAAHKTTPPPVADTDVGNVWMTKAERLIRSRAKYEIYFHVIRDYEEAAAVGSAVTEAYGQLKGRTNRLTGRGEMQPMAF